MRSKPTPKASQKVSSKKYITDELDEYQNKKVMRRTNLLTKRDFEQNGVRLSDKQTELYKQIRNNTLTIIHGPAGTSKTFTSCYTALSLLADRKVEKIIITKPIQESGEKLGMLPGVIDEKIDPYKQSYYSNFCKIIDKGTVDMLFATDVIKFEPLAYMRGSTYDSCVMMLDECQNASMKQLMLWITRLGSGINNQGSSYAIMMGDTSQYDVNKRDSGYNDFIAMTEGMNSLHSFKFNNEDIVRNKFLIELTNRYDKYRSDTGN